MGIELLPFGSQAGVQSTEPHQPGRIQQILFIHSSVGHFGCFHFLAIVNSAFVKCVFEHLFLILLGLYLGMGPEYRTLARSYGNSMFNFLRNNYTVFIAVAPFYIPISSVPGFSLLHILDNICYFYFLFLIMSNLVSMK